jgi:hypothetical protein
MNYFLVFRSNPASIPASNKTSPHRSTAKQKLFGRDPNKEVKVDEQLELKGVAA